MQPLAVLSPAYPTLPYPLDFNHLRGRIKSHKLNEAKSGQQRG